MLAVEECRDEDVETRDNIEIDNEVPNNSRSTKPSQNVQLFIGFTHFNKSGYTIAVKFNAICRLLN